MRWYVLCLVGLVAGCSTPKVLVPSVPIPLSSNAASTIPSSLQLELLDDRPPIENSRPDEVMLGDGAFSPRLSQAFAQHLASELQLPAGTRLVLRRASVKITVSSATSDTAVAVSTGVRSAPPNTAPGAGLAGALLGAAILDGIDRSSRRTLALAALEGRLGETGFAAFALDSTQVGDPAPIESAVRLAFAQAVRELRGKLGLPVLPVNERIVNPNQHLK